jgi:hypothetical protein
MLSRNCLIKHIAEGNIEGTRRRERRHKPLLGKLGSGEGKKLEFEKESTRSHSLEKWLWKRL